MAPLPDVMRDWHDLFALFGSVAATLTGLLFVAASVGSSYYSADRHQGLRLFLSPTLVHFSCVLASGLIGIAPLRGWDLFGVLIGGEGVFGVGYAGIVWQRMVRYGFTARIDLEDRLYYAALPAVAYAVMVAAGFLLFCRMTVGCDALAVAMGMLLVVGIRNAWDMTIFTVVRRPD